MMAAWKMIRDGVVGFPKLIDCHVHFREPGLTHKGDMLSEGLAAYHGGISIVCDMPNTIPPTQSIAELLSKINQAGNARKTAIYFFFGATEAAHLKEFRELWTNATYQEARARCCGLKLYLDDSTGDLKASDSIVESAFALCAQLQVPLVAHCEHAGLNAQCAKLHPYNGAASHSLRRPASSEVASIEAAILLARKHQTALHIAHLSTAEGLAAVRQARVHDPTLSLTCEVTPHHLFLNTTDYAEKGALVKVNPPIRNTEDCEALWEGLLDGTIDCVATDHAPHTIEEKAHPTNPPSGMPGVEVVVPLLLSVAAGHWPHPTAPKPRVLQTGDRQLNYADVVRVMHTNPSRIFSIPVEPDVERLFDVRETWVVDGAALHSKCGWSPYHGWRLVGKAICDEGELENRTK